MVLVQTLTMVTDLFALYRQCTLTVNCHSNEFSARGGYTNDPYLGEVEVLVLLATYKMLIKMKLGISRSL